MKRIIAALGLAAIGILCLIPIAALSVVLYVAVHFVGKFW